MKFEEYKQRIRNNPGLRAGLYAGFAVGTIATIWGGYEVGTTLNDAWEISTTIGRTSLDLVVMGFLAKPLIELGSVLGGGIGVMFQKEYKD